MKYLLNKFLSYLVKNIYNFFDIFHSRRLRKFYETKSFDLVIDVGSHEGEFISKVINKEIPVYSFEPQSEVRKILKKNTINNSVLKYYKYALSNYEGSIDLFINNLSSTTTTKKVYSSNKWIRFKNFILGGNLCRKIENVNVTRLDTILKNNLDSKKVLLKIDVEGGESEVLEGSQETLQDSNIVLVQIERSNYNIYENSKNPEEILLRHGFRLEKKFVFPLKNFTDLVFCRA